MSRASYVTVDEITLQNTANAIRAKTGKSAAMYPSQFATEIGNISGSEAPLADAVRFIDYDGTILHSYSAEEFLALSALPANPSHTGLAAEGWNWTLADAKEQVEACGILDIGQMYHTSSGKTEIDIELLEGALSPYLSLGPKGTCTVEWGDGTTSTVTGTSLTTRVQTQHNYSAPGNYTIKISIDSGSFALLGSASYSLLNANNSSINYNYVYAAAVNCVRLGSNITVGTYGCANLVNLKAVSTGSTNALNNSNSFYNCYNLIAIIFPKRSSSYAITNSTISNCYNLKYMSFPKEITTIGATFDNTFNLTSVSVGVNSYINTSGVSLTNYPFKTKRIGFAKTKNLIIKKNEINISSLLESNATTIPAGLCRAQHDITAINGIPNTVTQIEDYAFYGLTSLTSIDLNNITTIGIGGLGYCLFSSINTSKITSVGNNAFAACNSLQSIDLSNLNSASSTGFCQSCVSLANIELPTTTTVTQLGANIFSYCYSLRKITIPSNITTIKSGCFSYCRALSSITLPSSITTIEAQVFYNCYGLTAIHIKATNPPTLSNVNAFSNISPNAVFYVPSASLNTYKTADNWSTYASQMVGE